MDDFSCLKIQYLPHSMIAEQDSGAGVEITTLSDEATTQECSLKIVICYSDESPNLPIWCPTPSNTAARRGARLGKAKWPAVSLERSPHAFRAAGATGRVSPSVRACRSAVPCAALRWW